MTVVDSGFVIDPHAAVLLMLLKDPLQPCNHRLITDLALRGCVGCREQPALEGSEVQNLRVGERAQDKAGRIEAG